MCAVFQTRNAIEPIVGYAGEMPLSFSYRLPTYRERQEKKGSPAYRKIVRLNIFGVDAVARFRLDGYCETSSTERTTSCPRFLYAYIRALQSTLETLFEPFLAIFVDLNTIAFAQQLMANYTIIIC